VMMIHYVSLRQTVNGFAQAIEAKVEGRVSVAPRHVGICLQTDVDLKKIVIFA